MILPLLSFLFFVILLIIGVIKEHHIPDCISSIYYDIGYWFTILLGIADFLLIPYIISHTPETYQFTAFLCCAALLFVAFAPQYKASFTSIVHGMSAILSAICCIVWVSCTMPQLLIVGSMIAGLGIIFNTKNWTWWCEIACFMMIYITCLFFI